MKHISLVLLLHLTVAFANAQSYFQPFSFEDGLKKAKKSDRILMVRLESDQCSQCNSVAEQGLNGAGVQEVADKYTVAVSFSPESADWKVLRRTHFVSFGLLFFDAKGNLLHKYAGSSTLGETYITEIKKAVSKQNVFKEHADLEGRFKKGERDPVVVKELIAKKIELGVFHDGMVTIYLDLLPPAELYSKETIAFLIKTAPVLTSKADSVMRKDSLLFNQLWYQLPSDERVRLNQTVITKTRNLAISTKNRMLAQKNANYTHNTYLPDRTAGMKAWYKQMIYFFSGIRDTSMAYSYVVTYSSTYLFPVSKDSLERKDSIDRIQQFKAYGNPSGPGTRTIRTTKSANIIANEMDEMAQLVARSFKDSSKFLYGIKLSDKSIELFDNPVYFETKATLLQKLNRAEEAIIVLEQGLNLLKQKGLNIKSIQQRIDAIKQNQLTDEPKLQ